MPRKSSRYSFQSIQIGDRFGRLTVRDKTVNHSFSGDPLGGELLHLRCDCGIRRIVPANRILHMHYCDQNYCTIRLKEKAASLQKAKERHRIYSRRYYRKQR